MFNVKIIKSLRLAHLLLATAGLLVLSSKPSCQQQQLSQQQLNQINQLHQLHQKILQQNLSQPAVSSALNANQVSDISVSSNTSSKVRDPAALGDWFMLDGGSDADMLTAESKHLAGFSSDGSYPAMRNSSSSRAYKNRRKQQKLAAAATNNKTIFDDETAQSEQSSESKESDMGEDMEESTSGNQREPECASHGRYYCTYKEEYPLKLVTEVTKYYKWPLEKLFRDLHAQIMPKLAQDSTGNLVCDSITRVVRPGWTRSTNDRWLVVINTDNYHQYVTEVVCQYGGNSRCNFIPPCYYSSCQQRYNTQKLLVIDPQNPYRGPFLSEFLFPSCCVCYVPSASDSFQDKYRSTPATIYQRTLQQESANNLYPPKFRPVDLIEEPPTVNIYENNQVSMNGGASALQTNVAAAVQGVSEAQPLKVGSLAGPGEIGRTGDQYNTRREARSHYDQTRSPPIPLGPGELADFPRLGLGDSLSDSASSLIPKASPLPGGGEQQKKK